MVMTCMVISQQVVGRLSFDFPLANLDPEQIYGAQERDQIIRVSPLRHRSTVRLEGIFYRVITLCSTIWQCA